MKLKVRGRLNVNKGTLVGSWKTSKDKKWKDFPKGRKRKAFNKVLNGVDLSFSRSEMLTVEAEISEKIGGALNMIHEMDGLSKDEWDKYDDMPHDKFISKIFAEKAADSLTV